MRSQGLPEDSFEKEGQYRIGELPAPSSIPGNFLR